MKQLWWTFTLCVASLASAQDSITLLPGPLELPTRLGPLYFDGNPHQYEPAALGVSYQYNGAGAMLTVYVFDAGATDIPDGADTMGSCYLFEQAKREVTAAGYSDVRLVSEQLVRLSPPEDAPLAREAVFEFVRDGVATTSYVWMTSVAKHFVKVRFSMRANQDDEAEARRFLLTSLGDAIKPHLAARDPEARNGKVSLNLEVAGRQDEVTAAIMYLTLLAARADRMPETKPLCGGAFVPSFDTELSVFENMLRLNLEGSGSFGKKMAAMAKAGFLEEFIWVDRHRDAWGDVAPAGLKLKAYETWKKKNLKGFTPPRLGSVVFEQPRPLELQVPEAP